MKSEIKIQAEAFQRVWNELPQTRYKIFHIPNGGKRSIQEAMQLKASGVIAGVSDICFIWNTNVYFFEFKTNKGALSKDQHNFIKAMKDEGVDVVVIRDSDDFVNRIKAIVYANV